MPPPFLKACTSETGDAGFAVSSSLPPMVTGTLAGEIELSVPYFDAKPGALRPTRYLHDRQYSDPLCAARIQWWGEGGPGTVLKPDLLGVRDEKRDRARRAALSDATCVLFPVRCELDGLVAYLKDMGHIALDVLVHEGENRGARQVGRCIISVGSWDCQPRAESNVVAEGYFPVLSLKGNKYVGDLHVRLRICLGSSSRLRRILEATQDNVGEATTERGGLEAFDVREEKGVDARTNGSAGLKQVQETAGEAYQQTATNGTQGFRGGESAFGLPARASFDSDDLSNVSSVAPLANRLSPGTAPLSSFQLNEALAKFDVSDALPVWPTPKGSLYRPPETHGEAPPTPRLLEGGRESGRERLTASARFSAARKKSKVSNSVGRDARNTHIRTDIGVGAGEQMPNRRQEVDPERKPPEGILGSHLATSISPEQPAAGANPDPLSVHPDTIKAADVPLSPADRPASPHASPTAAPTAVAGHDTNGMYLAQLVNRGQKLREKMAHSAGRGHPAVASLPKNNESEHHSQSIGPLPGLRMNMFADVVRPGFVSAARLGSSLRDDIEGIFDTLSENSTADEDVGVAVRDSATRDNEDRVVNLLLAAAGPPPSSLAFPALAEVERRRADSLAEVRFLRIRLSRLVMFGSMTSSPEGHGWQLRFRLPAFAMPPGRGRYSGRASRAPTRDRKGEDVPGARVICLPVPARTPKSAAEKSRVNGRVGAKNRTINAGSAVGSMLRVRRGYGAADLVVGETSLLEEVICAVNIDDACVRRWMDSAVEFLLVDGRTDVAPPSPSSQQRKRHLTQKHSGEGFSSTLGPGDRVAAVATLPLRDLVLSAELGVTTTLDLTEVVDFWAAEDARVAAGRRGRRGRPLRNPYRRDSATAARPLVLGERAIGALAVAIELVPGEADISPEHSHPEQSYAYLLEGRRGQGEGVSKRVGPELLRGDSSRQGEEREMVVSQQSDKSASASGASVDEKLEAKSEMMETGEGGVALAEQANNDMAQEEKDSARWSSAPDSQDAAAPPPGSTSSIRDGEGCEETRRGPIELWGPVLAEDDLAMILRLDGFTLTATANLQAKGHPLGAVAHRSVRGFQSLVPSPSEHRPDRVFVLQQKETIPITSGIGAGLLGASASRVFEVWGSTDAPPCEAEGNNGSGAVGKRSNETLLGLAKVSLVPFSAFSSRLGSSRSEDRSGHRPLATAVDGPVAVVDPFSGRAIGELGVFLALGAASRVAALAGSSRAHDEGIVEGGQVACHTEAKDQVSEKSLHLEPLREMPAVQGGQDGEQGREEMCDGEGGGGGVDLANSAALPLLNDSVSELSMLLNPAHRQGPKPSDSVRRSGGFAGLVRHVVELCALGELPVARDAGQGADGEVENDSPIGCAVEYSLPDFGHASLDLEVEDPTTCSGYATAKQQKHELWWDADSRILNSRARHSIKLPGGMLDSVPNTESADNFDLASPEHESLHRLLDCMFGAGDLRLSLFWSIGGAGMEQQQFSWDTAAAETWKGPTEELEGRKRKHHFMGTALLRRTDLLPLVRRTSARAVLRLPIERPSPSNAEGSSGGDRGGREAAPDEKASAAIFFSAPDMLPLSVSYRREPSAVARRKSRAWSGRQEPKTKEGSGVGTEGERESPEDGDDVCRSSRGIARGEGGDTTDYLQPNLGLSRNGGKNIDSNVTGDADSERMSVGGAGETPQSIDGIAQTMCDDGRASHGELCSGNNSLKARGDFSSSSSSSSTSADSGGALVHHLFRTETLLPAHTTLCIRVDSINFVSPSSDDNVPGSNVMYDEEGPAFAYWAGFTFPSPDCWGREQQEKCETLGRGGGGENGMGEEEYCSPALPAVWEGGVRRVALEWCVELDATIDATFVRFLHTESLDVRIWYGRPAAWPRAGASAGVARISLRSLLTTLGGVSGNVSITRRAGDDHQAAGYIAARLFFEHRGLSSSSAEPNAATDRHLRHQGGQDEKYDEGGRPAGAGRVPTQWVAKCGGPDRTLLFEKEGVVCSKRAHSDRRGDSDTREGEKSPEEDASLASTKVPETGDLAARTGAVRDELAATSAALEKRATLQQPASAGGEGGKLQVVVERAMRLPLLSFGTERTDAGLSVESLPSTYVTFRWEEGGKPPLRSPFAVGFKEAADGGAEAGCGGCEAWPVVPSKDGEVTTPTVKNTQNPVFAHTIDLCVTTPDAWGHVCGPSAALVFRVWRRLRCSWWDAAEIAARPRPSEAPPREGVLGRAVTDGVRLGDSLIGSAVVGLSVLRGNFVPGGKGLGLREIDGWYHVLDDLRRPQGQLKICVRPQPPVLATVSEESQQEPSQGEPPSAAYATDIGGKRPHAYRPLPGVLPDREGGRWVGEDSGVDGGEGSSAEEAEARPKTPPLHDTQTHLRAVHALLDSLPPEYRSTVKQRPASLLSDSMHEPRPLSYFPSIARSSQGEEPMSRHVDFARGSLDGKPPTSDTCSVPSDLGHSPAGVGGDGEGESAGGSSHSSSLPEIRRLFSSLDRVDRRLLTLAAGGDTGTSREAGRAENAGRGREDGGGNDWVTGDVYSPTNPIPGEKRPCRSEDIQRVDFRSAFTVSANERAASMIQGAWRVVSARLRQAAAARAEQEVLEALAKRERIRTESARVIQGAYRRAQARHQARAALEERRRWVTRERRRAAACLILERAWKAFECRRTRKRELAEARARATVAVAEQAQKADQTARAVIVIQKLLRGGLSRRVARRLRGATRTQSNVGDREVWLSGEGLSSSSSVAVHDTVEGEQVMSRDVNIERVTTTEVQSTLPPTPPLTSSLAYATNAARCWQSGSPAAPIPRSLPPPSAPSTFYNQLSQDARRRHPLPEAHMASTASTYRSKNLTVTGGAPAEPRGEAQSTARYAGKVGVAMYSERFGPRAAPVRGTGVVRPPRFADLETARIARIMKGNLQHWAGVRSSGGEGYYSSSDDLDL